MYRVWTLVTTWIQHKFFEYQELKNTSMKIINLFYLIFLLCPITMYSQNIQGTKITIKGTVLDSLTNEVVPYATLRITTKDRPDVLEKAAATDDNG